MYHTSVRLITPISRQDSATDSEMDGVESLRQELQNALAHLYDPDFRLPELLQRVMLGHQGRDGGLAQTEIISLVEEMEPHSVVPRTSRPWRQFGVLYHRFVLGLTQDESARRLHMSVRSIQRVQREAVHVLATRLWERHTREDQPEASHIGEVRPQLTDLAQPSAPLSRWHAQVREEVASLSRSTEDAETTIGAAIDGALRVARMVPSCLGIELSADETAPGLVADVHPSILREIVLASIEALARLSPNGKVTLSAEPFGGEGRITIAARPVPEETSIDISLAQELAATQGGSIGYDHDGDSARLTVQLPLADRPREQLAILAVDDNVDLVSLFASYCAGTAYEIIHVREGGGVLEAIETHRPAIILLDVLLPDVDGWDLLVELRANPASASIPLIVCSVITDEQLALALGAAEYLQKPVWRQQLLDALDRCLNRD